MHVALDAGFLDPPPSGTAVSRLALAGRLGALPDATVSPPRSGRPTDFAAPGAPRDNAHDRVAPRLVRSGRPQVIRGDASLLAKPEPEPLATVMVALLDDPERRAALPEGGLARDATFSWEKSARLTLAAYEEAMTR